jgi:flagellar motor switch protein FliN/FliY
MSDDQTVPTNPQLTPDSNPVSPEAASTPVPSASQPADPASGAPEESAEMAASMDALAAALNAGVGTMDSGGPVDEATIDELLKQASFEDVNAGAASSAEAHVADTAPMELPSFQQVIQDAQASSIDLLRDVDLNVKIELGRSRMMVEDVLKLTEGSVVELDKLAGDPVDVFVNERLIARGEVLVLNDNFCVRVNEIVAGLKEEGV